MGQERRNICGQVEPVKDTRKTTKRPSTSQDIIGTVNCV
jgi:hypothetical protein